MDVGSFPEAGENFAPTEAAPLEALSAFAAPRTTLISAPAPLPVEPEGLIATFLYARLRNFTAACHTMTGPELTTFVNDVRRMLSEAAQKLGGEIAQRRPDSILCVFTHNPEERV